MSANAIEKALNQLDRALCLGHLESRTGTLAECLEVPIGMYVERAQGRGILEALINESVAADRERVAKILEWNTEEREDFGSAYKVELCIDEVIDAVRAGTPVEEFYRRELNALALHPRGACACYGEGWCDWCRDVKLREELDCDE